MNNGEQEIAGQVRGTGGGEQWPEQRKQHVQRQKGEEQRSPLVDKQRAVQCVLKSPGMASYECGDRDLVASNAKSRSLSFSWRQKQSLKNFKRK